MVGYPLVVGAANRVNAPALRRVLHFPEQGGLPCTHKAMS